MPGATDTRAVPYARSLLVFGFFSGCVFCTACVSISRSSALVLGGARVIVFCHVAMGSMWGRWSGN
jgi:hypothetical protein